MFNVSIREYFWVLNVFIVCIRNTARSKANPLMCTHVDLYMFNTVHPRAYGTMKLVSPKDLDFWEPKVSKYRKLSMQAFFSFLVLGDALGLSSTGRKKKKKPLWLHQTKSCTLQTP